MLQHNVVMKHPIGNYLDEEQLAKLKELHASISGLHQKAIENFVGSPEYKALSRPGMNYNSSKGLTVKEGQIIGTYIVHTESRVLGSSKPHMDMTTINQLLTAKLLTDAEKRALLHNTYGSDLFKEKSDDDESRK